MFKHTFIFIGLFTTTAVMADVCPSGYIAVERPYVVVADGACPTGYVSAGDVDTCPGVPRTLRAGNVAIKMDTTRRTAPSLNMHINGDPEDLIWYANMQAVDTPVRGKMHVKMMYNNIPTIFQVMDNINPGPANGMCVISD